MSAGSSLALAVDSDPTYERERRAGVCPRCGCSLRYDGSTLDSGSIVHRVSRDASAASVLTGVMDTSEQDGQIGLRRVAQAPARALRLRNGKGSA